jgi:hypothetical protein
VRLEKPEPGKGTFSLVMSPVEWKETHALAKFGQTTITYDAQAPYVKQVFLYTVTEPEDFVESDNVQAAFAALDRLAAVVSSYSLGGDVILKLPKEEMRQMLVVIAKAAESKDRAEFYYGRFDFLHRFPELDIPASHYAEAFVNLLLALHEDKSLREPKMRQRRVPLNS